MKPNHARLLARLSFALAASLTVALPAVLATEAAAQNVTAEERCRADLAIGTRRYMESVLRARVRCQGRIVTGEIPVGTECVTGRGDGTLDRGLRKAEDKLSNMGRDCGGVDFQLLGLPGACTDTTGSPFDSEDMKICVVDQTNIIVTLLLDHYFPPLGDFYRSSAAKCLKGSARDASNSFRRTLRAREHCLLAQDVGFVLPSVECRADIQPYGPGTGDASVDVDVSRAYLQLLSAIPGSCVEVQIDDLDYQSTCVDQTGGIFTIFDLKRCFFDLNRNQILETLQIVFPNDPVCGDGNVDAGEQCDLGSANNSDTQPDTCRTDCTNPRCHDGVKDPGNGEQCDDGNTVNLDCCSGECVTDICGDGQKSCGEQCDNGTSNSNTIPNACRTDCKTAHCGDGVEDTSEDCDDGNTANNDGCSALCLVESCGDDITQPPREECDNGVDNANDPNKCRTICKNPTCPDGIVDDISNGEDCDDGNTNNSDACPNTCAFCGNNEKAQTEECDGTDPNTSCTSLERCNANCECEARPVGACPVAGELTLWAGVGDDCSSNSDCTVGSCDVGLGKCRTVTRLDSGWNGAAHNADINNRVRTRGFLDCPGEGPVCGECTITGVDESIGTCRCSNNIRTLCDEPFATGVSECPSCVNANRRTGFTCSGNTDCLDAGACSTNVKVCTNANTQICTKNTDCATGGTCTTARLACSNLKSKLCTVNADCSFAGTCTGQADCSCYFGAPFPLSSGGTPACVVNRFSKNVTGTANVDLGQGQITANLRTVVYLGSDTKVPCPTCGGRCSNDSTKFCDRDFDCPGGTCGLDPLHDDGNRGGVCTKGASAGLDCDVTGFNTSFPAVAEGPSGGGYSLDCLPDSGTNISGQGLVINLTQSTGTSEMHSIVPCDPGGDPEIKCPCLQCSGDDDFPCNTHEDCSFQQGSCALSPNSLCSTNTDCQAVSVGTCNVGVGKCTGEFSRLCSTNADCVNFDARPCKPSTCSANGGSNYPSPNQCDEGLCTAQADDTGICTVGPDEMFCEGVVRGNGRGVLACSTNDDCSPSSVEVDARPCGQVERRLCFPDPIVATGDPDPTRPIGAATFCVPPAASDTINIAAGLPGPGRIVNQATSKTFCGSNINKQYIPGEGRCLD